MTSWRYELAHPKWPNWSAHIAWGIVATVLFQIKFTMPEAIGISMVFGAAWEIIVGRFFWPPKVIDLVTWWLGCFAGWPLVRLVEWWR